MTFRLAPPALRAAIVLAAMLFTLRFGWRR